LLGLEKDVDVDVEQFSLLPRSSSDKNVDPLRLEKFPDFLGKLVLINLLLGFLEADQVVYVGIFIDIELELEQFILVPRRWP